MAPGSCALYCTLYRSPRRSLRGNPIANLAGAAQSPAEDPVESASTAGSKGATILSHIGTPAPSCAPTPGSAPAPSSTENLLQQLITTYVATLKALEQSQTVQSQVRANQKPREKPLKAKNPDLYFGKSYMDCYNFCQQCEDHFAMARATGSNHIPCATTFLCGTINLRWTQYNRHHQGKGVVSITWVEFKVFPPKNLEESRSFIDSIWSKLKKDLQYQLEEVLEWAAHFKHLQSILTEFDSIGAPTETTIIQYFREGLKPPIKAKIDPCDRELDSFEELVEKAIEVEAKAALRPGFYARETDHRCLWGSYPTFIAKIKDPKPEDPKSRPQEMKASNFQHSKNTKTSEKVRKEKKKNWYWEKRDKKDKKKDTTPATEENAINIGDGQRKKNQPIADASNVTCYNCDKKGHYTNTCPKPSKN